MKLALAVLLASTVASGFAQEHLTNSSGHWDLSIDVRGNLYDVLLRDRNANAVAAEWHLSSSAGKPIEAEADRGGRHFKIRLDQPFGSLRVHLDIGGEQPDWMIVEWNLAAVRRQSHEPVRVGGDVKAPIAMNPIEPAYPDAARADRIAGIVILETEIDKSGEVRKIIVLKRLPRGLDDAAIDAIRLWRFKPGTVDGQPVDVIFNLTVHFKIDGAPQQ